MLPWILFIAAAVVAAALFLRNISLEKGINEITSSLEELLDSDSNTLITLSGGGKALRKLASRLNIELKKLKALRRKYLNGDRDIKAAVTNISHDLRTPLTAICGYIELLRTEEKSPAAERYLKYIENRAEAMKTLTEELFRYSVILSSPDEMELSPVDMVSVLEESVAGLYGALTERGIAPEITLPENKIVKNLNREALSRIYGNILSNALKYSDGDLTVTMDGGGETKFINTAEKLRGVDVGKLFDRFFSVEAAGNSTGLGLAISKTLCELMGGSIEADYCDSRLCITVSFKNVK